jgi:hypothetical protein
MQRTLIAVFDNRGDAQSALEELVLAGFSRQQMYLSEGDPTGAPGADLSSSDGSIVDSIKHFLSNMFGTDNSEHVQKYSDAVTRGHQVLTLTAADEREVERAVDIVERWGPVDIDEKTAQWSGSALAGDAMRMGTGAQQQASPTSQQSVRSAPESVQGAPAGTAQGSTQSGSQQRATGMQGGTNIPVTQRGGMRVFEHMAEPSMDASVGASEPDDSYFRSHYNSNYAGAGDQYDDYAPAYEYGSSMASDEQYRGRAWRDVEPQLRGEWEGRNPGSAWSKFKAAVRHGWEKITS